MTRVYTLVNQKGGVGKTTSTINLGAYLAHLGQRVLLVDLDPQGNATMGSGIDKMALEFSIYDVMMGEKAIADVLTYPQESDYDLLPSNADLTGAEVALLNENAREVRLSSVLEPIKGNYDFIFIDCPPSLNMLTVNALVAATAVIIPMQCEYYALEGLTALIATISRIAKTVNPGLRVEGILRTMFDPRNTLTNEVSSQLHEYFGDRVYQVVIPRNIRLAEAPSHGKPALLYDRYSKGSVAYLGMAEELLRRNKLR